MSHVPPDQHKHPVTGLPPITCLTGEDIWFQIRERDERNPSHWKPEAMSCSQLDPMSRYPRDYVSSSSESVETGSRSETSFSTES